MHPLVSNRLIHFLNINRRLIRKFSHAAFGLDPRRICCGFEYGMQHVGPFVLYIMRWLTYYQDCHQRKGYKCRFKEVATCDLS